MPLEGAVVPDRSNTNFAARAGDGGFTLMEALVALAVATAGLAAIGQLGYASASASRRAEARLDLISSARAALAMLPDRRASPNGVVTGAILRDRWRLATAPYAPAASGGPVDPGWTPQVMRLRVTDPSGGTIFLETVRLRRSGK